MPALLLGELLFERVCNGGGTWLWGQNLSPPAVPAARWGSEGQSPA